MSIEEQILTFLEEKLKTITIAGGFQTSAGQRVFRNLEYSTATQERPLLIVFTGQNRITFDEAPYGLHHHYFSFSIEGVVNDDERGTEVGKLRADLSKILFIDLLGYREVVLGLPEGVTIETKVENAGEDGFIGYVSASSTVLYRTEIGGF